MEILKVEHLVKQYGKGDNAVLAVNDISFSVVQEVVNQHFFTCLAVWTDLQVERYIYRVRIYIH